MRRGFISIVLLLTLSVCSVFSETCVLTASGQEGECKTRPNCKAMFIRTRPQVCDLKKRTICCPEKIVSKTTVKPTIRISDKKCGEYSTYINTTDTFYNSHGQLVTKNINNCGHMSQELIIRTLAVEKEFPHMALIGYGKGNFGDYKCGGSLISEQWVLSAAHCSYSQSLGEAKHIKLGGIKSLELEPSTKIFSIIENIQHPSYTILNVEHDIVLFKMNQPVTLNLHILPICLQQSEDLPTTKAIATGWGKKELVDGMSPILMQVALDYFPISLCQNSYKYNDEFEGTDFSNIICAGSNDTIDTCQGESGSPLQYHNTDHYCMYTVSGITVHGSSYCLKSSRGAIYTKVYKYLDWIENIVWPEE